MSAADATIGVVIPYYQREAGLLARALRSVFAQKDAGEVIALVVDDESPCPAQAELASLLPAERARVQLIEQANAGPAAARNRALDALPYEVMAIAYLDSDDWWEVEHLQRARQAFARGYQLYLSNWYPLESERDAYAHFDKLKLAEHPPLAGLPDAHSYAGNFFVQELTRPIGRLSTMVFARDRFGDLRFEQTLRTAFEDRLYRLEMARRAPRIAISARPECRSGRGVNLYSSKAWGTAEHLEIVRDELAAAHLVRRRFELSSAERALIVQLLRGSRRAGITTLLHLWSHRKALALRKFAEIVRRDPLFPLLAPWTIPSR